MRIRIQLPKLRGSGFGTLAETGLGFRWWPAGTRTVGESPAASAENQATSHSGTVNIERSVVKTDP